MTVPGFSHHKLIISVVENGELPADVLDDILICPKDKKPAIIKKLTKGNQIKYNLN